MIVEAGLLTAERLIDLMREADEVIAIMTASVKTARKNVSRK